MSGLLHHRLRDFIDSNARESTMRICATADFHLAFSEEYAGYSAQAIREAMADLGFDRTWIRMFRHGKRSVTSIYCGIELTCDIPARRPRTIQPEEPEIIRITPSIEFYQREVMPSIIEGWRRQYEDTLISTCRDFSFSRLRSNE